MNSETRRLNKLKDTNRNLAKRYKLPELAVKIIEKNGKDGLVSLSSIVHYIVR